MMVTVLHNEVEPSPRKFAPMLEECGYHRLWFGEHHSCGAIPNPVLSVSLAASSTSHLRCGTAGILLRAVSPYRLAEDFAMLTGEFGDRLDLGVVGALPPLELTSAISDGLEAHQLGSFAEKARQLQKLMYGSLERPDLSPFASQRMKPQLWICGMSSSMAKLAGDIGAAFAYHGYFARIAMTKGVHVDSARDVLSDYRDAFTATCAGSTPVAAIACYGMSSITIKESLQLWHSAFERGDVPDPDFFGPPKKCADEIFRILNDSTADEVILRCLCDDDNSMMEAYGFIAEGLSL